MRFLWTLACGFALLVLAFNLFAYCCRAHLLRSAPCAADVRLGILDAAWSFAIECLASAAVLLLIPIGWLLPRCHAGAGARGPVVLAHGWSLNRGSLWVLRRRLVRDGWGPVCCVEYPSVRADIAGAAERLRDCVQRAARAAPQRPIALVGHSLGGLVLRYYARRYPAPAVRRIVTLGTPHCGTQLAAYLPGLGGKLTPGAPLINALSAADHVPQQFDVIAIQSTFDALILPPMCGEYAGAFNVCVNDIGHHTLLFSSKVYELLAENLAAPLRGRSEPPVTSKRV